MTFDERAILALALVPHVRPQLFDPFLAKNPNIDRGFTEFGGILAGNHGGFWPTVETAAFILAGEDLERRFVVQALFDPMPSCGGPSCCNWTMPRRRRVFSRRR